MDKSVKEYECPACGLHYNNEATAKECEAWCSMHKSCNLDITKHSVEASAQQN